MTRPTKLATGVLLCVLAGFCLYAAVRPSSPNHRVIRIDTARPTAIEPPFQVAAVGDVDRTSLLLPAGAGDGWRGEGGGSADYRFYAPADGDYTLWGYCLWQDACTNAVYVQIDGRDRAILGNDNVFGRWHWVRGFRIGLAAGCHRLRLSNHSSNVAIGRLLLATDDYFKPENAAGPSAACLFMDDFNGCDEGNFAVWEKRGGTWTTRPRHGRDGEADNVAVGTCTEEAWMTLPDQGWSRYRLAVSVRVTDGGDASASLGLCCGLQDARNFREVRVSAPGYAEVTTLTFLRIVDGQERVLLERRIPWQSGGGHDLQLELHPGRTRVIIDSGLEVSCPGSPPSDGGLGFRLRGRIEVAFDNVRVEQLPR